MQTKSKTSLSSDLVGRYEMVHNNRLNLTELIFAHYSSTKTLFCYNTWVNKKSITSKTPYKSGDFFIQSLKLSSGRENLAKEQYLRDC